MIVIMLMIKISMSTKIIILSTQMTAIMTAMLTSMTVVMMTMKHPSQKSCKITMQKAHIGAPMIGPVMQQLLQEAATTTMSPPT